MIARPIAPDSAHDAGAFTMTGRPRPAQNTWAVSQLLA